MIRIHYDDAISRELAIEESAFFNFDLNLPERIFKSNFRHYNFYQHTFFMLDRFFEQFKSVDDEFVITSGPKESLCLQGGKVIMDLALLKTVFNPSTDQNFDHDMINFDQYHCFASLTDNVYIYSRNRQNAVYCSRYDDICIVGSNSNIGRLDDVSEDHILSELGQSMNLEQFLNHYNSNRI